MDKDLENVIAICKQIEASLTIDVKEDDGHLIAQKINILSALLSTSSHAVALSQQIYARKMGELTQSVEYINRTATDKKNIFAGLLNHEGYYVDLCDRQNKSIVHAIEALRSILSYLKTEMSHLQ
jgi:hypothetical protein